MDAEGNQKLAEDDGMCSLNGVELTDWFKENYHLPVASVGPALICP